MYRPNLFRKYSKHENNYTPLDFEILHATYNGKPVSSDAINLFWRLFSFPENENVSIKALSVCCGFSVLRVTQAMQVLQDLGYVKKFSKKNSQGRIESWNYCVTECLDETRLQDQPTDIFSVHEKQIHIHGEKNGSLCVTKEFKELSNR